jgi:hypothetical protein
MLKFTPTRLGRSLFFSSMSAIFCISASALSVCAFHDVRLRRPEDSPCAARRRCAAHLGQLAESPARVVAAAHEHLVVADAHVRGR